MTEDIDYIAEQISNRELAESMGLYDNIPVKLTQNQEWELYNAVSTLSDLCKQTNSTLSDLLKSNGYGTDGNLM